MLNEMSRQNFYIRLFYIYYNDLKTYCTLVPSLPFLRWLDFPVLRHLNPDEAELRQDCRQLFLEVVDAVFFASLRNDQPVSLECEVQHHFHLSRLELIARTL